MSQLDHAIKLYEQGKSSRVAAREVNISKDRLLYAMQARKIPRRTKSQAAKLRIKHLQMTETLIEITDGLLLGDGSLRAGVHSACFAMSLKSKDFTDWIQLLLEAQGITCRRSFQNRIYHRLETLSYAELLEQYERWYQPKKTVPWDVRITPLSVKLWYLGDGHLRKVPYEPTGSVTYNIELATCCFSSSENENLVIRLANEGVKAHVVIRSYNKYCDIKIGAKEVYTFVKFIGDCPAPDMEYKWPGKQKPPTLTRKQQEAIKLREQGLGPCESAEILGITREAVYSRLKLAKKILGDDHKVFLPMKPGPKCI